MAKGYRQVSLPDDFYAMVERFLAEHEELGYTSIAEFVRVAIREKMDHFLQGRRA